MLTLYSLCAADGQCHYSPHALKIVAALRFRRLAHRLEPVGFGDIPRIGAGSYSSVPVLDDGGTWVSDSFEIARHLDRAHPVAEGPRLFADAAAENLARMVESWCDTRLHPPVAMLVVQEMHDMMPPDDQIYFRDKRESQQGRPLEEIAAAGQLERPKALRALKPFATILGTTPWLAGDAPGFADMILWGALGWYRACTGQDLPDPDDSDGRRLIDWLESCRQLGLDASVTPDRNPARPND